LVPAQIIHRGVKIRQDRKTMEKSPESNGVSEAFVKILKRDYARVPPPPDALTVLAQLSAWIDDTRTMRFKSTCRSLARRHPEKSHDMVPFELNRGAVFGLSSRLPKLRTWFQCCVLLWIGEVGSAQLGRGTPKSR
jgi:hypothetical protein